MQKCASTLVSLERVNNITFLYVEVIKNCGRMPDVCARDA